MLGVFCVDSCTRNPPIDARACVTVYENRDMLKEDETRSGWLSSDGCDILSDQQTADIIRYVRGVVCNCDMLSHCKNNVLTIFCTVCLFGE